MVQFCVDSNGYYLGNSNNAKASMYKTMNEIMREMVASGQITQV